MKANGGAVVLRERGSWGNLEECRDRRLCWGYIVRKNKEKEKKRKK